MALNTPEKDFLSDKITEYLVEFVNNNCRNLYLENEISKSNVIASYFSFPNNLLSVGKFPSLMVYDTEGSTRVSNFRADYFFADYNMFCENYRVMYWVRDQLMKALTEYDGQTCQFSTIDEGSISYQLFPLTRSQFPLLRVKFNVSKPEMR